MCILVIYMYGAMSLKYVAGAESLYQGLAYNITGDQGKWDNVGWVYYASIGVFGTLSVLFSFGDIENSKNLQIFTSFMRVFILFLFYLGSVIDIAKEPYPGVYTDWSE